MEELLEIKNCLVNQKYERALFLVEELEAMGRQDKINNLESFLTILLLHLIKIQVEKRVTRSRRTSIINSLRNIQKRNKLGKKSFYIQQEDWLGHIKYVYPDALVQAADEAFGGIEVSSLQSKINLSILENNALELINLIYQIDGEALVKKLCDRFNIY